MKSWPGCGIVSDRDDLMNAARSLKGGGMIFRLSGQEI